LASQPELKARLTIVLMQMEQARSAQLSMDQRHEIVVVFRPAPRPSLEIMELSVGVEGFAVTAVKQDEGAPHATDSNGDVEPV
jgi:hypothetical protein